MNKILLNRGFFLYGLKLLEIQSVSERDVDTFKYIFEGNIEVCISRFIEERDKLSLLKSGIRRELEKREIIVEPEDSKPVEKPTKFAISNRSRFNWDFETIPRENVKMANTMWDNMSGSNNEDKEEKLNDSLARFKDILEEE